jgi:nicotinate dehydrogenase subunit B
MQIYYLDKLQVFYLSTKVNLHIFIGEKMPREITLHVNGQLHSIVVDPETPLIYVLRNDLGLKGVKMACGLEQCGACTVLLDGEAVPSCRIPVRSVQGREITTIEGIGTEGNLHPLQQAFVEEQALQCGFCATGIIVAAKALLDRNSNPSVGEIKATLAKNLCRCGVNHRVIRAIQRAAGQPLGEALYQVEMGSPIEEVPPGSPGVLPEPLHHTPDLDSWIRINPEGTITIFTGKVDYGQGIKTAFAQIGADELEVSLERIQVVMADTDQTPNEGMTVGSMSMQTSGNAIRYAAAQAREYLLSIAFEELEVPVERLLVEDGTISDPDSGRSTTYWELMGGKKFGRQLTGEVQPKGSREYKVVGQPARGLSHLSKVTGRYPFIHDLDLPGMVYARVVRPPHYDARLVSLDEALAAESPGVLKVVRDGSFLGVIAEREEQAVKAARILEETTVWEGEVSLPSQEYLFDHMLESQDQAFLVVDGIPEDGPVPAIQAPPEAAYTIDAIYQRPYQMHASLGPSAAVAQMLDGKMTLWIHSQGVFPQRRAIAHVLGMSEEDLHVIFVEGPGCYGQNGADDAALDAALLARAFPGRPISLKWERKDEHSWEPYGPAMVIKLQASLNKDKEVIDWNHDTWGYTHLGRFLSSESESAMVGAWYLERPFQRPKSQPILANNVGIHRNADPYYSFPHRRIVKHFLPESPLRASSMRGLGAYGNIFALESFMDELADVAEIDPIEFRLKYLQDKRARAVIEAAAERVGWGEGRRSLGEGSGRGMAFSRYKNQAAYVAVIVELHVERSSGQIGLERAVIAADAGQIVNPDSLSSQLEGGFLQAASWTLKEQVRFDLDGIISTDWYSYPIHRFPDVPDIEVVLINRPDQPFLGIGEGCPGPAAAAVANAIFDAVGIRLRQIPFTAGKVLAALSGVT